MFGYIFAIIGFLGDVIVQIFKKIFTLALLAFLFVAITLTTIILVVFHQVT